MKLTIELARPDVNALERVALLSARERDVFKLIGRGIKKSDLATRLRLSGNTVETHRQSIRKKLRLKSGAAVVRLAVVASLCRKI